MDPAVVQTLNQGGGQVVARPKLKETQPMLESTRPARRPPQITKTISTNGSINNSCRRRHVCRAIENLIAIEPTRSNGWVNPGHLADTIH